jgi:hypothetical protein
MNKMGLSNLTKQNPPYQPPPSVSDFQRYRVLHLRRRYIRQIRHRLHFEAQKHTPTNKRKAQNRGPKTHYNATTQQQKATGAAASTQQQKATAARILI